MTADGAGAGGAGPGFNLAAARASFLAVARIAKWDMIDLAFVVGLAFASIGVGMGILGRYLTMQHEAGRLAGLVARNPDVDQKLASFEERIATHKAELAALRARVPADLKPERVAAQLKAKADEAGLALVEVGGQWDVRPVARTMENGERLELLQHDRTVEVRGDFKQVLHLLGIFEADELLIALRGISVRPADVKRGRVAATLDLTIFKAAAAGGGGP